MENNAEFDLAWRIVEETGENLFLTGSAGTGKTTFIRKLKLESRKRVVVLAPTGIAAINAGGVTIHSFFQLPFTPFVPGAVQSGSRFNRFSGEKLRLIRMMDVLVIDEISMVRADVLDAVDDLLRRLRDPRKPFGGVQLVMIGDLYQLPPVVKQEEEALLSPYYNSFYFFESRALNDCHYEAIELTRIFRQNDRVFTELLGRIRENRIDRSVLDALNCRYIPGFGASKDRGYIILTTHNNSARQINDTQLESLSGVPYLFSGKAEGDFPEFSYPADAVLTLKAGAQVMFLRNVPEKGYYNGMIGFVRGFRNGVVQVEPADGGDVINVEPVEWQNVRYTIDEVSGAVKEEVQGTYRQYPLKLSWAITIHKSQGLTFDRAVIDVSNSFAHGQTYVALSRCRSLEGLVLNRPLTASSVICDSRISEFVRLHSLNGISDTRIAELKRAFFIECLDELFDMGFIERLFEKLHRTVEESLMRLYPTVVERYRKASAVVKEALKGVSDRFKTLYSQLAVAADDCERDARLQERVRAAAKYFNDQLMPFMRLLQDTPVRIDNKAESKRLESNVAELREALVVKQAVMNGISTDGFTTGGYLEKKGLARMKAGGDSKSGRKRKGRENYDQADVVNPDLFKALVSWRERTAERRGVQQSNVTSLRTLMNIANSVPCNPGQLKSLGGVGPGFMKNYGREVLALCAEHGGEQMSFGESPEAKPEKEKKQSTFDRTYEMWKAGMSVAEIARERSLTPSTIESHMARFVGQGLVEVRELMSSEKYAMIARAIDEGASTLSEVIGAVGQGRVSYGEINYVIADRRRRGK